MKNPKLKILFGLVLFLFGFVFARLIKHPAVISSSDSCNGDYSFINPRFACGYKNIIDKKGYVGLKSKLRTYIEEKKTEGKADIIAVWFRDLEFGPTFGINDRKDFIPASLLKLPMALTYYSLAEDDPALLERRLIYGNLAAKVADQTFVPRDKLVKNEQYTIDELIRHSIADSDNIAGQLIYEYLEKEYPGELSKTYRDLGILEPGHDLNVSAVNVKGYGSIFRMLYNVSFLNKEMSEKLLLLLGQTYFEKGLEGGVPDGIIIAHKFGERYLKDGEKQLHDCGIVYYPENPYQLCVMTQGRNFNDLAGVIGGVSRMIYEEFDSRNLTKD